MPTEVRQVSVHPESRNGEQGAVIVVALLVMVLLLMLGATLLTVSEDESQVAVNDQWSEGAFYAAEAAVQESIDGLSETGGVDPVELTEIGDGFTYRSGSRDDNAAQPPELVGTVNRSGYAVGSTTGYNSSTYVFNVYQINGTGMGPRNAEREVEVEVEIGPVAQ
jgi:Tfp pilus assembly protein PilX